MTDYFTGARLLGREPQAGLQDTQASPAPVDYFTGARQLDMPQSASLDTGRVGQFSPGATSMNIPEKAPLTWRDTAADVGKSTGIGLAQGVIGMASLPGNIEMLGRMGIDKGAELFGYENPNTSAGQVLPHYGDYKDAWEQITGKFYEPMTVPGEYARTAGEFAPMAASGPGGWAARTARVAVPATISETAGQMTKDTKYEPWARMAGAMSGSIVPRAVGRTVSPAQPDANRAHHIAVLEREGINPTAGQRSGSRGLMYRESNARDTWGAGAGVREAHERPLEQFTQAMMRRAGSNAPRATSEAIDDAFTTLGNRFEQLSQQATLNPANPGLRRAMDRAVREYERRMPDAQRSDYPRELVDEIAAGPLRAGDSYGAIRSRLSRESWESRHTNPEYSRALAGIRDALDAAVERGLPANQRGQYRQTREQYRNLLAIANAATGAGEDVANGLLTPQRMRQAMVGQDKRSYARGSRDMDEITRAGNVAMPQLPNSGTPARLQAMGLNALMWGAAGSLASGNPAGVAAAAGGPIGQALYARGLMSGPVQRYLSHQTQRPSLMQQALGLPLGPIGNLPPNALMPRQD